MEPINQDIKPKNRNRGNRKSPGAAICSALGSFLLIALIALCLPLTAPKAFGYHIYTVISGSMEPAVPVGSLVYIESVEPEDVAEEAHQAHRRVLQRGRSGVHYYAPRGREPCADGGVYHKRGREPYAGHEPGAVCEFYWDCTADGAACRPDRPGFDQHGGKDCGGMRSCGGGAFSYRSGGTGPKVKMGYRLLERI